MKKEFNVFWVDDKGREAGFIEKALLEGVVVHHYKYYKDLNILYQNPHKYDAVLLDIKGLYDEKSPIPDNKYVIDAIKETELFKQKKFPIVLMSGEEDSFHEGYVKFIEKYKIEGKFFDKKDSRLAIEKIKELCVNSAEYDLKSKFSKAFELLTLDSMGDHKKTIVDAFSNYEEPDLRDLREVVEGVRDTFADKKICPKKLSLNDWSRFFDRNNRKGAFLGKPIIEHRGFNYYLNDETKFSRNLSEITRFVVYVTQNASHKAEYKGSEKKITKDLSNEGARGFLNIFMSFLNLIKDFLDSTPKENNWTKKSSDEIFTK